MTAIFPEEDVPVNMKQYVQNHTPTVGANGITKIEPYNEFAGPDYVLWFAIYVGEPLTWRVNGRYVVEIYYAP